MKRMSIKKHIAVLLVIVLIASTFNSQIVFALNPSIPAKPNANPNLITATTTFYDSSGGARGFQYTSGVLTNSVNDVGGYMIFTNTGGITADDTYVYSQEVTPNEIGADAWKGPRIVFRQTDGNNMLNIAFFDGAVHLLKLEAGNLSIVASSSLYNRVVGTKFKLDIVSSPYYVSAYVNDQLLISNVAVPKFNAIVGVQPEGCKLTVENFLLYDIVPFKPSVNANLIQSTTPIVDTSNGARGFSFTSGVLTNSVNSADGSYAYFNGLSEIQTADTYVYSLDVTPTELGLDAWTGPRVIFRHTDSSNYLNIGFFADNVHLIQNLNNVTSIITSNNSYLRSVGTKFHLDIISYPTAVTVYVNGTIIFNNVTVPNMNAYVGIQPQGCKARLETFMLYNTKELYTSPNWNNTLYQSMPKDYTKVATVKQMKKDYQILSYAYGGLEDGTNYSEFCSVVDKAQITGYTCIMVSVGPLLNNEGKFDLVHTANIKQAFQYVANKNMKLMVRTYPSFYGRLDYWSDGTSNGIQPDYFDKVQFDKLLEYNMKFIKEFDTSTILSYSPTFGLYGQSLYDANFDTSTPFTRTLGYSTLARDFFNAALGYTGSLPIPPTTSTVQSIKTVQWFKTRQNQLTRYAETVVDNMKKATTKPIGVFGEVYSGNYTPQSEASPMNLDFWLEDCSYGSQTYDRERTFCETDGNSGSATSYSAYITAEMPRIEDAASKGAKLMGLYRRRLGVTGYDANAYCFQLLTDIQALEATYSFDTVTAPKVGVYFGANYAYSVFSYQKAFALKNQYLNPAVPITNRIETNWRGLGTNWQMFADVDLSTIDFSKYTVVFLPNFAYFEKSAMDNIKNYPNTYFCFTGDFALGYYDVPSGYTATTAWGSSKIFESVNFTYTSFSTSKSISVINTTSLLGKNLSGVSHSASRIANATNLSSVPGTDVVAKVNNMPFIYTRNNGKHIFITTNIFGDKGLSPTTLTNTLVDNVLKHAGL